MDKSPDKFDPQERHAANDGLKESPGAGDRILLLAGIAIIVATLFLSPGGLLDKADHVGYAVCHQIPVRSYFFGDRQLPLCARCSGQYLGALFGLVSMIAMGRGRAGRMPPTPIVVILAGFIAIWAFDGLNSYLTLFPGAPHLYEPSNFLRVTTGGLQGVALIALVWPFFNVSLWAKTSPRSSIGRLREVGLLLVVVALIVALVNSEFAPLLYPLALLSVAGTLIMLTLVNTMIVVLVLKKDGAVRNWREALPLVVAGLALSSVGLLIIVLGRSWLTDMFGLPL
ncbi:MAG: DUF2085 domain-containing protein [Chloroflexota bacterium]|nr:DUF2085 domain-containing protein [Chloroflexota bacterium]